MAIIFSLSFIFKCKEFISVLDLHKRKKAVLVVFFVSKEKKAELLKNNNKKNVFV